MHTMQLPHRLKNRGLVGLDAGKDCVGDSEPTFGASLSGKPFGKRSAQVPTKDECLVRWIDLRDVGGQSEYRVQPALKLGCENGFV